MSIDMRHVALDDAADHGNGCRTREVLGEHPIRYEHPAPPAVVVEQPALDGLVLLGGTNESHFERQRLRVQAHEGRRHQVELRAENALGQRAWEIVDRRPEKRGKIKTPISSTTHTFSE